MSYDAMTLFEIYLLIGRGGIFHRVAHSRFLHGTRAVTRGAKLRFGRDVFRK